MTVRALAGELHVAPEIIANCIALHLFLEERGRYLSPMQPPTDYWVPLADDVITPTMLDPSSGSMFFVEAALAEVHGEDA